jgi:hypothetical protein
VLAVSLLELASRLLDDREQDLVDVLRSPFLARFVRHDPSLTQSSYYVNPYGNSN